MRIISWNVLYSNKNIQKDLEDIRSLLPNIICLQELPRHMLSQILSIFPNYYSANLTDFHSIKGDKKNGYIYTLCRMPIKKQSQSIYYHGNCNSILNNMYYHHVQGVVEDHLALSTQLTYKSYDYTIFNARLSCAVPPIDRLLQLENILKEANKTGKSFICGDFNIAGNLFFNFLSGWVKAYRLKDYSTNERLQADELIDRYGFQNPFAKQTTTILPLPNLQWDHILVPKGMHIQNIQLLSNNHSDHKALMVNLEGL